MENKNKKNRRNTKNSKNTRPDKGGRNYRKTEIKEEKLLNLPVKLGQVYEIKIESLGSSAEGVGRVQGFTVFVNGALPDEVVKVQITELKKSYAPCNILEH